MSLVVAKEKDRSSYRIRFSPDEKDRLDAILESIGGPQFVCERLLRWYGEQPDEIKLMIIGSLPASKDLTDMILRRLSAAGGVNKGSGYKPLKAAMDKKNLKD